MARLEPLRVVSTEVVERSIYSIRGHNVMLDVDLAVLYRVPTKVLVQAVKRNAGRFPLDFMFRLDVKESRILRSQSVTSNRRGGRRYPPYAFTEQGVAMLSSVLRSRRAIHVNIAIMRTFVRLRDILTTHKDLAAKLTALERKYDKQFAVVFEAIRELMVPSLPAARRQIGFRAGVKSASGRARLAPAAADLAHCPVISSGSGLIRGRTVRSRSA